MIYLDITKYYNAAQPSRPNFMMTDHINKQQLLSVKELYQDRLHVQPAVTQCVNLAMNIFLRHQNVRHQQK